LQLGQCLTSIDEEPTDTTVADDDASDIDDATTDTATDRTDVDLVGDYYLALRDDGSVVICKGTPLQGNCHQSEQQIELYRTIVLVTDSF
jgi:hypothetical protein